MKVIQWLGVMALLTVVAMGLWMAVADDHQSTEALKWFQFVQTIGTFLLPPLVCAWLWSEEPMEWLHIGHGSLVIGHSNLASLERSASPYGSLVLLLAVGMMIVAVPGINMLADWNSRLVLPECMAGIEQWMRAQEEAAAVLTQRFLGGTSVGVLIVNIGLLALLPAMAEELTFRGVVMGLVIGKWSLVNGQELRAKSHIAVWVTAILFSAIHLQFYGFVPRMLLGALFGYALLWTGTLWIPIVMHFTNNVIAVIAYWCVNRAGIDPESIDAFGTGETLWLGIVSLVLTAVGIYFFWRLSRQMSNASSRMSEGS